MGRRVGEKWVVVSEANPTGLVDFHNPPNPQIQMFPKTQLIGRKYSARPQQTQIASKDARICPIIRGALRKDRVKVARLIPNPNRY
jgi:hypothetical protein